MLRVLVADDHRGVLRAITRLLEGEPCVDVCGTATDGRAAVQQFRALRPDLVILDFWMPEMNGLEAAREIHALAPYVGILVCTLYPVAALKREAQKAGVLEVIPKEELSTNLLNAVRSLLYSNPD